jgi:hypothetical protein
MVQKAKEQGLVDDDTPDLSDDGRYYLDLFFSLLQVDGYGGMNIPYSEISHVVDRHGLPEEECRRVMGAALDKYRTLQSDAQKEAAGK